MRDRAKSILSLAAAAVLSACLTTNDVGEVLEDVSWELVEAIPEGAGHTVAVYYFTEDGKVSDRSEYLINRITTEVSNAVREEGMDVRIVSRSSLDRLMKEQEYQAAGFTDAGKQIEIGRQLGADLIITGTITPSGSRYELNAQLIEIRTAAVLGGAIRTFRFGGKKADR